MAITPFNPIPDVTTHADATSHFNANFADAEGRLTSIESDVSQISGEFSAAQSKQKLANVSSTSGVLHLDASQAYSYATTLHEDIVDFSIDNVEAGDFGSLFLRQDATGGWFIDFGEYTNAGTFDSVITGIAPSGSGACVVGWYNDGTETTINIGIPY